MPPFAAWGRAAPLSVSINSAARRVLARVQHSGWTRIDKPAPGLVSGSNRAYQLISSTENLNSTTRR